MFLEGPQHHIGNEGHNEEEEGEEPHPRGGEGVVVHPEGVVVKESVICNSRGRLLCFHARLKSM